MDSMRSKFKQQKGFTVCFKDIAFYTNDDCTRYVHLLLFIANVNFLSTYTLTDLIVAIIILIGLIWIYWVLNILGVPHF